MNDELRRLLAAGLDLLRRNTAALPRVSDIVAAANSSNDAFYRAFGSREAFLAVVVDDGLRRLLAEVERRVDDVGDHAKRVSAALDAVLDQARDDGAATTMRALLAGASRQATEGIGLTTLADRLADRLEPELDALRSPDARRDAVTLARAALGVMEQHLAAGTAPGAGELTYLTGLAARMTGRTGVSRGRATSSAETSAAEASAAETVSAERRPRRCRRPHLPGRRARVRARAADARRSRGRGAAGSGRSVVSGTVRRPFITIALEHPCAQPASAPPS